MPTRRTEGRGNGHKAAKSCVSSQREDKNQTPYEAGQVLRLSRKLNPHTDTHTCTQTQIHAQSSALNVKQTNGRIEMLKNNHTENTSAAGGAGKTWLWMTPLARDGSTDVLAMSSPVGGSGGESSQCSINPTPCLKLVVQNPALAKSNQAQRQCSGESNEHVGSWRDQRV